MKTILSARERWKLFWRTVRIAQRIAWEVSCDTAIYGVGAARITEDGKIERVPPTEIFLQQTKQK